MAAHAQASTALDTSTQERLQRLADARGSSPDALVRQAVDEFIGREERREQFRQDTLEAWADFQATGLHVTGAEADAWLARLEAGEDAPPPTPHK